MENKKYFNTVFYDDDFMLDSALIAPKLQEYLQLSLEREIVRSSLKEELKNDAYDAIDVYTQALVEDNLRKKGFSNVDITGDIDKINEAQECLSNWIYIPGTDNNVESAWRDTLNEINDELSISSYNDAEYLRIMGKFGCQRSILIPSVIDRYNEMTEASMIPVSVRMPYSKAEELGLRILNGEGSNPYDKCDTQFYINIDACKLYFEKSDGTLTEGISVKKEFCQLVFAALRNETKKFIEQASYYITDVERLKRLNLIDSDTKTYEMPISQDGNFFKKLNPQSQELCIKVNCEGHGLDGRYIHVKRTEHEKVYNISIYDSERHKVIDYKYTDEQTDIERNIVNIAKAQIKKYYGNLKHCSYKEISGSELNELKQNNSEPMFLSDKLQSLTFKERLEYMLAGQGDRYENIYVSETPDILQKVGCDCLPVLYSQGHLRAAVREKNIPKHYHGLTVDELALMPNLLAEPIFLYDSLGNKNEDAVIIAVTDQKDNEQNTIVIIVKPNSKGQLEAEPVDSNFVATMYGHENITVQINEAIKQDKLLYIDKNKSQTLSPFAGLQLSRALDNSDSKGIVHQSTMIVKESETWLGATSQIQENSAAKNEFISKAKSVTEDKTLCNDECKCAESKICR